MIPDGVSSAKIGELACISWSAAIWPICRFRMSVRNKQPRLQNTCIIQLRLRSHIIGPDLSKTILNVYNCELLKL